MAEVVEHLPSKHNALSSNFNTAKKKGGKKAQKGTQREGGELREEQRV
jgi:hypothetical protein